MNLLFITLYVSDYDNTPSYCVEIKRILRLKYVLNTLHAHITVPYGIIIWYKSYDCIDL